MSLWSRLVNSLHRGRVERDIDDELQTHIDEAVARGRDRDEARRALGSALRHREASHDVRLIGWLEALRADAVFGWRQLLKRKVTSAAAILSLALAIGACVAAFRIIDAVLWRPLPIAAPERLYLLTRESADADGRVITGDNFEYPLFRQMRAQVQDQAELIAISSADRIDLTFAAEADTERAYQQYVSGWMFESFGIRPALGRVFAESDDLTPGAHPYAVLAYGYWKRRFAGDPTVVGRTFRAGNSVYQIIGVAESPFTGTEPGTVTDIFLPTMMMKNNAIARSDYQWFRTFVQLKPRGNAALVIEKLQPTFQAFMEERRKVSADIPTRDQKLVANAASTGASGLQEDYRTALFVLAVLVLLVLLISCANVTNLMTAQAVARQREMALRVSIGAGRWRLVQLVVVECAWLAFFAAGVGACFAWWAAPWIVGAIGASDNPARLVLPADWRVMGFGGAMALGVTILFGLAPALRASQVQPASVIRTPVRGTPTRLMQVLIATQMMFCTLVLFVAGLFLTTSIRLTHQPTGFSADRLLTVEAVTPQPQPGALWEQVAEQLRVVPGVEAVALCEWPLMTGGSWNGFISVDGAPPRRIASDFLAVSPQWRDVMTIPLLQGRDFLASEPLPNAALVNKTFARQYFGGGNPIGRPFDVVADGVRVRHQIVGLVGDARYQDMRESMPPTAYFPFNANYGRGTFMVRTSSDDPLSLAATLRLDVPRARAGFRVSNILTQAALIERHTVRERLLALLALFFGAVALSLAGIGLFGVLDYSVLQRRRDIAIRLAVGAQPREIVRTVIIDALTVVLMGSLLGIALGIASARFIATLLFDVKATDVGVLAWPATAVLAVAVLAALPAVVRAVRTDPARILRSE